MYVNDHIHLKFPIKKKTKPSFKYAIGKTSWHKIQHFLYIDVAT